MDELIWIGSDVVKLIHIIPKLRVPARIVWTRFCNSGRLSDGIRLTGFEG